MIQPHELIIFTKFQKDWTKIVDFFINGQFLNVFRFFVAQTLLVYGVIELPLRGLRIPRGL